LNYWERVIKARLMKWMISSKKIFHSSKSEACVTCLVSKFILYLNPLEMGESLSFGQLYSIFNCIRIKLKNIPNPMKTTGLAFSEVQRPIYDYF